MQPKRSQMQGGRRGTCQRDISRGRECCCDRLLCIKLCSIFKHGLYHLNQNTRKTGNLENTATKRCRSSKDAHQSPNSLTVYSTFLSNTYANTHTAHYSPLYIHAATIEPNCPLAPQSIMSRVQIDNISVDNPKAAPADTIHLAVTFSALVPLPHPLIWRLTYVGSAFSEAYDQLLEQFEIGPIQEASTMSFTVEVDPPVLAQVPREELLSTAALIMSVHYRGQEFARIGYYVLNSYRGEAEDASTLPLEEVLAHTERVIIHEKPRVTKFDISWQEIKAEEMEQPEGSCLPKEARQECEPREQGVPEQRQASKAREVALDQRLKQNQQGYDDREGGEEGREAAQPSSAPQRDDTDI